MNRRDFVSKGVSAMVAGSQAARHRLLAAESTALGSDNHAKTVPKWTLASNAMRASLGADGTIHAMEVIRGGNWEAVEFCHGPFAGPAWADVKLQSLDGSGSNFAGTMDGVRHSLRYGIEGNRLAIVAGLKNERLTDYAPSAARLVLGINAEMLSYPTWNDRYFPTLLRCEKTHFWGYFMTPHGRIMTVASPDPVASYTMNYELSSWGDGGHLIYTCSLDLMHALPLPLRHPQNLVSLKAGEDWNRKIYLERLGSLEEVKPSLAASLSAPMIDADRYTLAAGENSVLSIWAPKPVTVTIAAEDGTRTSLAVHSIGEGKSVTTFAPRGGPGLYKLTVAQDDGHVSEACFTVRHP